jgi:hypothetical protein
MRTTRTLLLALAVLLVAPSAVALGCSIALSVTRPHIEPSDLRFVHHHRAERAAWVRGDGWTSARVQLIDAIMPRFLRRPVRAAYAQQRALRMMASRPTDGVYRSDADPATPACELAGRRVYSHTRLLVRETPRAVFVTLVSHRTSGSTIGCVISNTSCDGLVLRSFRLQAPIGERRLYAVTFPDA